MTVCVSLPPKDTEMASKKKNGGLECSSVVESSLSFLKALGLIHSTIEKQTKVMKE